MLSIQEKSLSQLEKISTMRFSNYLFKNKYKINQLLCTIFFNKSTNLSDMQYSTAGIELSSDIRSVFFEFLYE